MTKNIDKYELKIGDKVVYQVLTHRSRGSYWEELTATVSAVKIKYYGVDVYVDNGNMAVDVIRKA